MKDFDEYEKEYNEEFDPNELVYILYVQEVGVKVDATDDIKNDETFIDEERHDIDSGSSAYYFKLDSVEQDFDGKDSEVISKVNSEKLYKNIFTRIMNEFTNSDYDLYEGKVEKLTTSKKFEYCIEYNGKEYIAIFKQL